MFVYVCIYNKYIKEPEKEAVKEAEEKAAAEKAAKTFDDTKLSLHAFLVVIADVQQVLELVEYSAILHPTVFLHVDLQSTRLVLKHLMF